MVCYACWTHLKPNFHSKGPVVHPTLEISSAVAVLYDDVGIGYIMDLGILVTWLEFKHLVYIEGPTSAVF